MKPSEGAMIMSVALARDMRAMVSFDVHVSVIIGLALHWSWIWIVFWSSLFYNVWPDSFELLPTFFPLETLWVLSLFTNFVGAAFLGVLSYRLKTLGVHIAFPIAASLLASLGTLLVAQPASIFSPELMVVGYAIGALITGLGSAIQFALWGELLTILGVRQTVIYNVAAILFGGLVYFVALLLHPPLARNIVALFPVVGMIMYMKSRSTVSAYHGKQVKRTSLGTFEGTGDGGDRVTEPQSAKNKRRDVLTLVLLSLFFGLSYGLMKGLLVHEDVVFIAFRDGLNIISFVLGALAALVTMSAFKMDFGSLTYQMALPLMAAGFLLMSFEGYLQLFGFALHQIGYQYFYAIIWALWPVFAKKNFDMPIAFFSCMSITSMQSGQFFGSFAGTMVYQAAAGNSVLVNQVSTLAIFVILLVALFGFSSSRSAWGLVRPMGQNQHTTKFKLTCEQIAATRGLTARESEVFFLLAKGRNADHICTKLVISKPTVKTHIKNIYRKLGVHSHQALLDMIELETNMEH